MVDFPKALGAYKKAIDKQLEIFFQRAILVAQKKDPLVVEALKQTKEIALSGGKRIRGALVCVAYEGFGGKEKKKILKVALAIELMHLYLLIHDDIIDRGELRHGKVTLQKLFSKKRKSESVNAEHYGNSIAIIVGDMLIADSTKLVAQAGFDAKDTLRVIAKIQDILATTIVGQAQDISIENNSDVSEKQVLSMYTNKTAKYTFEGPLQIGAILAGVENSKTMKLISNFSVPLGMAYQIQDDLLGIFSAKNEGKSSASDIEEGKKTLLLIKAQQAASSQQKKELEQILGKKDLNAKEIAKFQEIIIESGSLDYSKKIIADNFAAGRKGVEKIIMLPEQKNFLISLIQYLQSRKI